MAYKKTKVIRAKAVIEPIWPSERLEVPPWYSDMLIHADLKATNDIHYV